MQLVMYSESQATDCKCESHIFQPLSNTINAGIVLSSEIFKYEHTALHRHVEQHKRGRGQLDCVNYCGKRDVRKPPYTEYAEFISRPLLEALLVCFFI
jgi:hypothetical protein